MTSTLIPIIAHATTIDRIIITHTMGITDTDTMDTDTADTGIRIIIAPTMAIDTQV